MAATAAMPLCRALARLSNFDTSYPTAIRSFLFTVCGQQPGGFKILFYSGFRFRRDLSAYFCGLAFDK